MASPSLGAGRRLGPSDKVNLAVIGAGGKGADNMAKLTGQNIVASCAPCNRRKGDRLPHQINMHPRQKPRTPSAHIFIQLASPTIPATWKQYLLH